MARDVQKLNIKILFSQNTYLSSLRRFSDCAEGHRAGSLIAQMFTFLIFFFLKVPTPESLVAQIFTLLIL